MSILIAIIINYILGWILAYSLIDDMKGTYNNYDFKNFKNKEKLIIRSICITGAIGALIIFISYCLYVLTIGFIKMFKEVFIK